MKRILIRAGMSPFDNPTPMDVIRKNSIGKNSGNLVYAYGVYRALSVDEDTVITPNRYSYETPEEINEKYDCYVIPMADAFRSNNKETLRNHAKIIRKLKIPCYLIGAGIKMSLKEKFEDFDFNEEVKEFISAILDKSAMIGVRGEITSEYLSRLGFKEGQHQMAIGCPSMYTFGNNLKIKQLNINKDSFVCFNSSVRSPEKLLKFLDKSRREFSNCYFIPQRLGELVTVYTGIPYGTEPKKTYPRDLNDSFYKEDRVRFFVNVPSWLEFLRQADFSFGARLHGNIAAVISGVPSLVFVKDMRMDEVVRYHKLASVRLNDITAETNIFRLIEKADFTAAEKAHEENFRRYVDFLNKNGIKHIFSEESQSAGAAFDKKIESIAFEPAVKSVVACSPAEIGERFGLYSQMLESRIARLEKEKSKVLSLPGVKTVKMLTSLVKSR